MPENVTYPCGQCALYSLPNHILTLIAGVSNIVMNRFNVSLLVFLLFNFIFTLLTEILIVAMDRFNVFFQESFTFALYSH